ncbi:HNH endonuclease [Armatimonas sp.]|uniref:HNH endonuclease n=1 Tax=Armatimonas sp. TaxID=1872638 RepID=UPI00286C4DDA|nr:HNH endonuclease [Armatimonas sp.]
MPELILTAELVPSTSWYNNLRNVIAREDWDWIRGEVYAYYESRCAICGVGGSLHCHEVWLYDDAAHTQTLEGFVALCPWCHHIKHLGYAGILASEGKLDYRKLIAHFMKVNGCDKAAFDAHHKAAMQQWEKRSRHQWRVELGEYAAIILPQRLGIRR